MTTLSDALNFIILILDYLPVVIYSLKGKIHSNMVQGQLNTMGQGFGTCYPYLLENLLQVQFLNFNLKNTYCLLIHRIIQNVPQSQFSTLTYKLYSFSIPHLVKTHKTLQLGSEVFALLLGWSLCMYRGVVGERCVWVLPIRGSLDSCLLSF